MVERRPGVIPPKAGPPPPRRPSPRQVARRRIAAVGVLVLALGGLGWLAVAAIGGGKSASTTAAVTTSSTLLYSTATITTNGKTTETVIAMPKPLHVVFPEGFTIEEMAQRVGAVKGIAEKKRHVHAQLSLRGYLAAVRDAGLPPCFHARAKSMEGFLFPATYEFFKTTTNAQLVQDQLGAFCENWSRIDMSYAKSKNLTPYDVLIIASMIEKETLSPDERGLVSAVIYNRLHDGMPLGIDATIRYGFHIPPTQSILQSQLDDTSNPYNSRKLPGLPPTPIANPGLASMQAAAHPAKVNYLYFVRKPDKKHHFFTASAQAFAQYEAAHGYGQH